MINIDTSLEKDDKLREECGVFGVFGHPDAAAISALGLHALQHRGQEAAGIVTFDGSHFHAVPPWAQVGHRLGHVQVHRAGPACLQAATDVRLQPGHT